MNKGGDELHHFRYVIIIKNYKIIILIKNYNNKNQFNIGLIKSSFIYLHDQG